MDNRSIIKQLKLQAALMELHDENSFKIRGFNNAVFNLDKVEVELATLSQQELEGLEGVGKSIATTIYEIVQKGASQALEDYFESTPQGIIELLDMKGIGPKKIKVLWKELGIESGHELKEAANSGLVANLKGFGEKTQQKIIEALEFKEANANKLHYAEAELLAEVLMEELSGLKNIGDVAPTGALRRKMEVIEVVELLVAADDFDKAEEEINALEGFEQDVKASGPIKWVGLLAEHATPICLIFSTPEKFVQNQLLYSGSVAHLATTVAEKQTIRELVQTKEFDTEEGFYKAIGLDYIAPELREGFFEIEAAKNQKLPKLVEMEDLKGILHNHSTYSDGKHSLEQMATYCKELGYEYLGMCDHSKSAFYANGLDEDRIIKQHKEIDELNEKLAPFKIFKGIESDILYDGQLDYADDVLESFDFIVASVHSQLNMNEKKATERLLAAIENPYTTILGHPTGRLLLRREGYPIDHKAVIDHCAKHNVVIEINANPWRLDLDWRWVHYAIEQGVQLSINPDAHEMDGYHHMKFGLLTGRKGGLTAEMTFNALPLAEIEKHFVQKKSQVKANA
ncbi:DNA polymerase (family 10) [Roseivirga pacifica]|uniref:DNA polymerase (Family 10) n=1 Tax=Roseivirga pacifica TaxID=1267423 RepID=A0A1I0M8A5_9BACT|nr:DNA polymerase/3'-5' exonuclease PolX [Roseivirga pacifica]RKQ50175.1 DNA polymerase (family 10) [Roseivirga pacifica]SEV84687.1 DNA polymerase (family 10) [Roseivirga pacifica]